MEVESSQCIPSLWVVLDCLPDIALIMIWQPVDSLYLKANRPVWELGVHICHEDVCVMSLDRFVCVAWMPVLSINAAKL